MKTIIFLGPTMPVSEAERILDALYLPPAGQADVMSSLAIHKPDVIGIIDGENAGMGVAWHKEILYALESGVPVYGAGGIGALRAVETADFGMIGVGEVYGMYSSGELNGDDEIMLEYGAEDTGYSRLSEPMVNIRMTLRRARDEGVIDEAVCIRLITIAKSIYYKERTLPAFFAKVLEEGVPEEVVERIKEFFSGKYVDIKHQDAVLLLNTIKGLREPFSKSAKEFKLNHSHVFNAFCNRDRKTRHNGMDVRLASIANHAALHMPGFSGINFNAMNRALVVIMAEILGVGITEEDVDNESKRFRFKYRLSGEKEFKCWLEENDLTGDELRCLMREMAVCRRMQKWLMTRKYLDRNVKILLDELRLMNCYKEWAVSAASKEQILRKHFPNFHKTSHNDISMEQLIKEHLRETDCRMDVQHGNWSDEAGFSSTADMRIELLRSRLARKFIQELAMQAGSDGAAGHSERKDNPENQDTEADKGN